MAQVPPETSDSDKVPPDSMGEGQWYQDETYYQILEVSPVAIDNEKREEQKIHTKVLTKQRQKFDKYTLDQDTINKLKGYPIRENDDKKKLSSYLPSSGVVFSEAFIKALSGDDKKIKQTGINNFYSPMRTILYSRKISQLIAKTWWCYLEAKERGLLDNFADGDWDSILRKDNGVYILDGLIAREIFLFGGGSPPDDIGNKYKVLTQKPEDADQDEARFIILATSKSWQGISLSLLLAGQVYYEIKGEYHQISQPILSTGEITGQYSIEVNWNQFEGDIREIIISQEKPWVGYHVVLPYPPIPTDVEPNHLKKWADAEDDGGDLPFYNIKDGKYLMDVKYFRAPYPYIPLSSS